MEYVRAAVLVRGLLAVPIIAAIAVFTLASSREPLVLGMVLGGAGSVALWAFNITGYLDGKGKSALSGPISGLAWITAGAGVVWGPLDRPFVDGAIIGVLFMVGVGGTVAVQHWIARKAGISVARGLPPLHEIRRFAQEGSLYCVADLPAQIYGRFVIVMVMAFLGKEIAGIYVYVRQVIVAASQALTFVLRVEFPKVARQVNLGATTVETILKLQVWSVVVSIGLAIMIGGAGFGLASVAPTAFLAILHQLPGFALLIPAFAVAAILGQTIIARSAMNYYAMAMLSGILGCLGMMYLTLARFGLMAVVVAEAGMYIFLSALFVLKLRMSGFEWR